MIIDGDEQSFDDLTRLSPLERKRVILLVRGRMRDLCTDIGYYGAQWSAEHYIRVSYLAAELQCCVATLLAVGFDPTKDNN